jgi:hypothetical protein
MVARPANATLPVPKHGTHLIQLLHVISLAQYALVGARSRIGGGPSGKSERFERDNGLLREELRIKDAGMDGCGFESRRPR